MDHNRCNTLEEEIELNEEDELVSKIAIKGEELTSKSIAEFKQEIESEIIKVLNPTTEIANKNKGRVILKASQNHITKRLQHVIDMKKKHLRNTKLSSERKSCRNVREQQLSLGGQSKLIQVYTYIPHRRFREENDDNGTKRDPDESLLSDLLQIVLLLISCAVTFPCIICFMIATLCIPAIIEKIEEVRNK